MTATLSYDEVMHLASIPVRKEESIGVLFRKLGFADRFIFGTACGGECDWGWISLSELDERVKKDRFWWQGSHVFQYAPTNKPAGSPSFKTSDGADCKFISARWIDNRFLVSVEISQNDVLRAMGDFTVPQLQRLLIG